MAAVPDSARTVREVGRELADHRGEDEERHAVADAPLGDELTDPHEQGGAGGEA